MSKTPFTKEQVASFIDEMFNKFFEIVERDQLSIAAGVSMWGAATKALLDEAARQSNHDVKVWQGLFMEVVCDEAIEIQSVTLSKKGEEEPS